MKTLKDHTILVITGKAGAGKDTLADMVREYVYGTKPQNGLRPFRFSDPLKDAFCSIFGWNRARIDSLEYKQELLETPFWTNGPTPSYALTTRREIMQYLGTDVFRKGQEDVWIKAALNKAADAAVYADGFISTDCRFPNELASLYVYFKHVVTIDLVKSGGAQLDGAAANHESERGPYGTLTHRGITVEAGDLLHLRRAARHLARSAFPELCEEAPSGE